jgi:hypothetical protein
LAFDRPPSPCYVQGLSDNPCIAVRWFVFAAAAVVALVVVGALYATGPKCVGGWACVEWATRPAEGPWASPTTECIKVRRGDRANAWDRISGSWRLGRGADNRCEIRLTRDTPPP